MGFSVFTPLTYSEELDLTADTTGAKHAFGSTITGGFFHNAGAVEIQIYLNYDSATAGKALRIPAGKRVNVKQLSFKSFWYKTESSTAALKGHFTG